MILTPQEFELLLNALAFDIWLKKDNLVRFQGLGIKTQQWPNKCKIKGIIEEFIFHAEKDGWDFARQMFADKIAYLSKTELPEDPDSLKLIYHRNLESIRINELATELITKPFDAMRLIDEFKESTLCTVNSTSLIDLVDDTREMNKRLIESNQSLVELPDFPVLSKLANGFNPGRVSLLSAISGFGKTKIAVNIAYSASKIMPVLFFNMEMSQLDFAAMFLHRYGRISNQDWAEGTYLNTSAEARLDEFKQILTKHHDLYITTGRSLTIQEIEAECFYRLKNNPTSMVVIDYDQKLNTAAYDAEWFGMLKNIERLEQLAFKLNTHILILTQANEEGQIKSSARAMQPASLVVNFEKNDIGKYILKCKKNRFGPNNFEIEVKYEPQYSIVEEIGLYEHVLPRPQSFVNKFKTPPPYVD